MKLRLPVVLSCVALIGAIVAVNVVTNRRAAQSEFHPPTANVKVEADSPKAKEAADGVKLERDSAAVFQRAFWRRPGPDDRILHGERRDWVDANAAVQKWQWFVAVAPSPEFRRWLIEENPFELAPVTAATGGDGTAPDAPPAWFPKPEVLAGFAQYRNRGGHFFVFHDSKSNRIFATDAGSGFAAANR